MDEILYHKINPGMLNVRFDEAMEEMLSEWSRRQSLTKTHIVRQALQEYFNRQQTSQSAFDLGKDLFGVEAGGSGSDSVKYKQKLKDKLHGKYPRRCRTNHCPVK